MEKGQLFLVSIVFLIGIVIFIQHALFQYSSVNFHDVLQTQDMDTVSDISELINKTVKTTYFCNETKDSMEEKMEMLKNVLLKTHSTGIYSIDIVYTLNCSNWENQFPKPPPLSVVISLTGYGKEIRAEYSFYHKI